MARKPDPKDKEKKGPRAADDKPGPHSKKQRLKKNQSGTRKSKPSVDESLPGPDAVFKRIPSWWPLPIFMFIGLLFRLSTTLWEPLIYPDSMQYMHLAKEIRTGAFFKSDYDLDQGFIKSRHLPPLEPFLLAPFAADQADLEKVGTVISLTLSTLTFIPVYIAMVIIYSRRAAIVACAIMCPHAFVLWYASPVLTEPPFTLLYVSLIAASAWAFSRPSLYSFILCGVLSSLLYQTRDVGITATPLIGLGAFIKLWLVDRVSLKRVTSLVAVLLVSFLVVTAPYFAHIRIRTGHFGLTVQMDNTSITRQVQLFGGGRFYRDMVKAKDRMALIGEEEAQGLAGMVKLAPLILKKTVVNMFYGYDGFHYSSYGLDGGRKLGPFILAMIFIACAAIFREYLRGGDRPKLFMGVWVIIWILQIWILYAMITPYMVDVRYMYPLMLPGIMVASHGITAASERVKALFAHENEESSYPSGITPALIAPIVFATAYIVILPALILPESFKKFIGLYPNNENWFYVFPLTGAVLVFMLAAAKGAGLAIRTKLRNVSGMALAVASLALFALGIVLFLLPRPVMNFARYLPGALLAGAGLVLLASLSGRSQEYLKRLPAFMSVVLAATACFVQIPDYMDIHNRRSEKLLPSKYAAGHKMAATEIKAMGLIPRGKVICSRKPFMAYYLDGHWYVNKDKNEPIPKSVPEVEELIASGAIDYLVADSFTFRSLRPYLTGLAYGLYTLRGARVIYSRYFHEYKRTITVYDCRHPQTPLKFRASADAHLRKATEYYQNDLPYFAYREIVNALEMDPRSQEAWRLKMQILQGYYMDAARSKNPTLILAPGLLARLIETTKEYLKLSPADRGARMFLERINEEYRREYDTVQQMIEADRGKR
jgi:hypothetical protein